MKYQRTFLALSLLTNLSLTSFLVIDKRPIKELTPDKITSEVPVVDGFAVKRDTFFNNEAVNYESTLSNGKLSYTKQGDGFGTLIISGDTISRFDYTNRVDYLTNISDSANSIVTGTEITTRPYKEYIIVDKLDSSAVITYQEKETSIRLKLTKQR